MDLCQIWGKLPTVEVLASWGIVRPSICVLYRENSESMDHLFSSCKFVAAIIHKNTDLFAISIDISFGFHDIFKQIMQKNFSPRTNKIWRIAWATYFWMIWGARNKAIHKEEKICLRSFWAQLVIFVQEIDKEDL